MPEDTNGLAAFEAHDVEAVVQDEVKLAMKPLSMSGKPARDPFGRTARCGENRIILNAEF